MNRSRRLRSLLLLAVFGASLALLGCVRTPPSLQEGADAESSHDGLHRVDGVRRFARVWLRPGVRIAAYTKLLPLDAGIHYRQSPRNRRDRVVPTEEQLERARQALGDAFRDEVDRAEGWEIVAERGPDVLVVRGALIDLYVKPDDSRSARDRSFSTSAGEATLLVELYDSETLEILARIADRRAATMDESTGWRDDGITNRAAARKLFRSWSRRLVDGLDAAREITPIGVE